MQNIEVPSHWSQTAINILAQKYFRKAGVPNPSDLVQDTTGLVPSWLENSMPIYGADVKLGSETSAKQVFHRLAGAWTYFGWKEGIFKEDHTEWDSKANALLGEEDNARKFYDEIYFMLAHQYAAPNSPQWFNCGLWWAYGIKGDANGQWAVDDNGVAYETDSSYEHPQVHACYIQPITDNLVEKDGIFDLLTKEARLFKHGSGTGTNFSNIRGKGEKLAGGGVSSGLMSFLKIFDTAAGAISSGGTTRRAAKMVCLDLDHPEIEDFIDWKMKEERKARALVLGSEMLNDEGEIYNSDFEGEAINTVSAQNANNSVRITNDFLNRVDEKDQIGDWHLTARKGDIWIKVIRAKQLWEKIIHAAWSCGDPGLQFHDIIQTWHTCKNDGQINASNPCSEYMFLDNTACNLASLNLGKFLVDNEFQIKPFEHATRLWTIILEISVYMASFPSKEIAENSYLYRTLGLGYMNLGGLLMRKGFGYDSDEGRDLASSITALMHGISYLTSQEMALELGPFQRWDANQDSMTKVVINHKACLKLGSPIWIEANNIWNKINIYERFRNAQVTLQAPTGTIHLVTDCDTSGVEPDFSLIKYKNLSGGGVMKIVNECVSDALSNLDYTKAQITSMIQHISEEGNLENYTINGQHLPEAHLKVFDCANPSGNGERYLSPLSHVKMMATIQPFLSGAISKTCNLPNSATISDVDFIYREAHRLGLKAIAIYRDGCKLTQPLSSKKEIKYETNLRIPLPEMSSSIIDETRRMVQDLSKTNFGTPNLTNSTPNRRQLPFRRKGYRQKVQIDGQSVYLSTGEYENGKLGEIWIEISREGSTVRALLGGFSKAISVGLQYGVPLEKFIDAFVYTKFEPAGIVQGHDQIKTTTSVLDFIFRELAIHYLNQKEFANVLSQDEPDREVYRGLDNPTPILPIPIEALKSEILAHSKTLSFTGNTCPNCGHNTLLQTGTCITCSTCGVNTGCG